MWIFLWIVVSCFIMGTFLWSVRILFQQKAAWKNFAQKMGLSYVPQKGLLVSPVVSGALGQYGFSLFSEPQPTNDQRGVRYNTVIEFALRQGVPSIGAVGTQKMNVILDELVAKQAVQVADPEWDSNWFVRATRANVVQAYLTPARIDVLKKIFRLKTLGALFLFNESEGILRIETSDPMVDAARLEKIVRSILAQLPVLLVAEEERQALLAIFQSNAPVVET
ncbi:MAG: hypothetical protein JWO78_2349 [Micavibrio sp.]|nr:hypothetical protein [Micavibrio sp.]